MRRTPACLACACTIAVLLPAAPAVAAGAEREAIDRLNEVRRAHGLPALRVSGSLKGSAGRYAKRMIRHDVFGHGPQIQVAGQFRSAGETLAWHSGWHAQPRRTVRRWLASPTHHAVLMSSQFRWIGIGLARGRLGQRMATTWVAQVGSR